MANPPVNRRPGVDADIFQGEWVRGYDVPAGDQTIPTPDPCDLIVSNGQSQIDTTNVSNLIFASRTDDIGQPIFVMAQGPDAQNPTATLNFHIGEVDDPNGLISGVGPGALYASYGTPGLWQLQVDDTTWVKISDDLGGENLAETLAIGDFTGGNNIVITSGDFILGEEDSVGGDGGPVNIQGGPATGAAGDGGPVNILGGTTVGGLTGALSFTTPDATTLAGSGAITIQSGDALLGGTAGGIRLQTGDGGDVGVGAAISSITIRGGRNFASGGAAPFAGGQVFIQSGQGTSDGQGGTITLLAGISSNSTQVTPVVLATPGAGGAVRLFAGSSSGTQPGGAVSLTGGAGGSGGAIGGNIFLNVGTGGGGFPEGEIIGNGNIRTDNIKRGDDNPNIPGTAGNEGDIYQRTATGLGELWVNTNGANDGWQQLAFAGSFIESFNQLSWGYISPAGRNVGGTDQFEFDSVGVYNQVQFDDNGTGGTIAKSGGFGATGGAPTLFLSAPVAADFSALDMDAGTGPSPVRVQYNFAAHFAANVTDSANTRYFLGFSSGSGPNQLSVPNCAPGGGTNYVGFVADPGANPNWRVITRNGLSTDIFSTGIPIATTAASAALWHFVIDCQLYPASIQLLMFDENVDLQAAITLALNLPGAGIDMGLIAGCQRLAAGFGGLQLGHCTIVNQKGIVGEGAGAITSGLTLAQVLNNGNETGATNILINQGANIAGVADDNLGDGTSFGIFGGGTTGVGNDSGSITTASGNRFIGGAGETGFLFLATGFQFDVGSTGATGDITIASGDSLGTGATGDIIIGTGSTTTGATGDVEITTGIHTGAGGGQGNITIAAGTLTPSPATVSGDVFIKGGSTTLVGVSGGDIAIFSGEADSAQGDTGDIAITTFNANLDGDSGDLLINSGAAGTNAGDSGGLTLLTGAAIAGNTGNITMATTSAGNGNAGVIAMAVGGSTTGNGSDITLLAGNTTDAAGTGGNIELTPGTGPFADGVVRVNGKLTVTGVIDPTALVLDGSGVIPAGATPAAGQGTLWIDNNAVPSKLIFTDDTGSDHDISTGGGATTLGALTDVSLTPLAAGEVLTYTGVTWTNLPGAGGSPLATILAIGNTTGALPIVVSDTLGSSITSDDDLQLNPAVAPGSAVVIDGMRWPEADGLGGYVLTTNGLGQTSWQPGGGGGGSFIEAFAQMQFGNWTAIDIGALPVGGIAGALAPHFGPNISGIFGTSIAEAAPGPGSTTGTSAAGIFANYVTLAVADSDAGLHLVASSIAADALSWSSFHFNTVSPGLFNTFIGLTDAAGFAAQLAAPGLPLLNYVGLQLLTDQAQATYHFVTDNGSGAPLTMDSGISPGASPTFWLDIDWTTAASVTLTLYDTTRTVLATHTFNAQVPPIGTFLSPMLGMRSRDAVARVLTILNVTSITRADVITGGGGGGNQNLASVLGFGNETGGLAIQGDTNAGGAGGDLELIGGESTGGGGVGGTVAITTGTPDPGGNGNSGNLNIITPVAAGTGDAGDINILTGTGGPGGGDGGEFQMLLGSGVGVGSGGSFQLLTGSGGAGGGASGDFQVQLGSGAGGNAVGGAWQVVAGDGFGTGNGGAIEFASGDGGGGGGDGGNIEFTLGTGATDGVFLVNGDAHITGKLTVDLMIDPPGLLMSSSGSVPFTPAGTEGGIWVNGAGELIFTNTGGDLNISTAVGGGLGFLDALLISGYGFMGPGNSIGGPQSYGVYGSSVNFDVVPPGAITLSTDSDGPILNLALGAVGMAEAYNATRDLGISLDQQFKAVFKFQSTSPAHGDERIFIGFTDDTALATPTAQLSSDHPVAGLQYVGLMEDLASGTMNFVAQGSGGAMAAVAALPTDALVHYLQIDASASTGDVTFTVYDADGVTISNGGAAQWTEPSSFLLPDLTNPLRPFLGLFSQLGTTPRGLDFYFSSVMTRADIVDAVAGGGGGGGTPVLAAVLAAGNTTGGTAILVDAGITGDGSSDVLLTGGSGGAGGPAQAAIEASSGDNGGDFAVQAGAGAGAAGDGGEIQMSANDGSGTGDGGDVQFAAGNADVGGGDGGAFQASAGSAAGGNGLAGDVQLSAGMGWGTSVGGSVDLIAGTGGGGGGAGDGGFVNVNAGSPAGAGLEGGVVITAGGASALIAGEGAIQLIGSPTSGSPLSSSGILIQRSMPGTQAGNMSGQGGAAPGGSGDAGGDIAWLGGAGDAAGRDGRVQLLGTGASISYGVGGGEIGLKGSTDAGVRDGAELLLESGRQAGNVALTAGLALPASGVSGGDVNVTGGGSDGAVKGGLVNVVGGIGGATGDGGDVSVVGGGAIGGVNVGGDVNVIGGASAAATGGNVTIAGGAGGGGQGLINFSGKINPAPPAVPGLQYGAFVIPVPGPGPFLVPFNVAFPAPPTTVTYSIESAVVLASTIVPASVVAGSFTVATAAGLAAGDVIYWTAYL